MKHGQGVDAFLIFRVHLLLSSIGPRPVQRSSQISNRNTICITIRIRIPPGITLADLNDHDTVIHDVQPPPPRAPEKAAPKIAERLKDSMDVITFASPICLHTFAKPNFRFREPLHPCLDELNLIPI